MQKSKFILLWQIAGSLSLTKTPPLVCGGDGGGGLLLFGSLPPKGKLITVAYTIFFFPNLDNDVWNNLHAPRCVCNSYVPGLMTFFTFVIVLRTENYQVTQ